MSKKILNSFTVTSLRPLQTHTFSYNLHRLEHILLVVISLMLLVVQLIYPPLNEKMRAQISLVVQPLTWPVRDFFHYPQQVYFETKNVLELRKRNESLAMENRELQYIHHRLGQLEEENRQLKKFLNFHKESKSSYRIASVIADYSGFFTNSVLLGAGASDNIKKGQAVISDNALVGVVIATSAKISRVLLINDANSRVPVISEHRRELGLLLGLGSNYLELTHVEDTHGFVVGERLLTSPRNGILPPNLPVAVVTAVSEERILARPLVKLSRLEYLLVVDYQIEGTEGLLVPYSPLVPSEGP